MKIFGVAGWSGMGKTTLLARLVPELASRGLVVSLVKHSHKDIEVDRPGKDSYRLREAGCHEVMLLGASRWALMHELRGAPEPSLAEILARLAPCDLVLLEGFKQGDFPKLEVWRPEHGRRPLWPQWPGIVGIATHEHELPWHHDDDPTLARPELLDLSAIGAIAEFVLARAAPR